MSGNRVLIVQQQNELEIGVEPAAEGRFNFHAGKEVSWDLMDVRPRDTQKE